MKKTDNYIFFDYEDRFSKENFNSVPIDCTPVFAWLWNSKLSFEATDKGLIEFKSMGVKTLYVLPQPCNFSPGGIPTTMYTEYLGEDYMKHYAYATKMQRNLEFSSGSMTKAAGPRAVPAAECSRSIPSMPEDALPLKQKLMPPAKPIRQKRMKLPLQALGA